MADYLYEAFDESGATLTGLIEAESRKEALEKLQAQELSVSSLELKKKPNESLALFDGVGLSDLEYFTTEMSLLLDSGVRVNRGIEIILKSTEKKKFKQILVGINADLRNGKSLADSMSEYPDVFDALYINLIRLGESSGSLSSIFTGLAEDLTYKRTLRGNIISALTYPSVILAVCIMSIVFIFNYIIPQMSGLFESIDDLPVYTQLLLDTSAWMQQYQLFLFAGIIALIIAIIAGLKKPAIKARWDRLVSSLPGIRKPILLVERIRFCGSLSLMLNAGMKVNQAMELCIGNLSNSRLIRQVEIALTKVRSGNRLTTALEQTELFPPVYTSLLEVGEESGNLERIFREITRRTREDFTHWTNKMTTLIEPLLILFMGVLVGGVVIIMLLSMVSVNDIGI